MTRYFGNKIVPALANLKTFSFLCRNCFRVQLKRKIMKYKLLFLSLSTLPLLISTQSAAQGVYLSNQPFHDTAIVRSLREDYTLTYMDNAFYLYNVGDYTAQFFHVPFIVNDVKIWDNDVAYFCGKYGNRGVIGQFNIFDVFAGTASVNYAVTVVPASSPSPYYGYLDVLELTRLALFGDATNSSIAMAMVCRERLDTYPNEIRTGVMGAIFNQSSGNWLTSVLYNKDGEKVYHDIETLDHMVVSTMTDTNYLGCFVRPFDNTSYHFPGSPFVSYGGDEIVFKDPMGPPQITKLDGNIAAVVQYDRLDGLLMHFLEFDLTTGQATALFKSAEIPSSTGYQTGVCLFNGTRMTSSFGKTLYILGKMSPLGNHLSDRWLLEMPHADTALQALIHWLSFSEPFSMDIMVNSFRPITAGIYSDYSTLDWDVHIPQQNSYCQELCPVDALRSWPNIQSCGEGGYELPAIQKNLHLFPIIFERNVDEKCIHQQP